MLLVVVLIGLYWLQSRLPDGGKAYVEAFGLSPSRALAGDWKLYVTSMFLHGSWVHVLANSAFAFAFGPPVARLFGTRPGGALAFYAFYLVCGVAGGLGYVLTNVQSDAIAIGASGAVSGLMGAAIRLLNPERRPGSMLTPTVIAMSVAFIVLNLVIGPTNLNPGTNGAPVAWQDHIAGYLAGFFLIGPWARLFAPPAPAPDLADSFD